MSRLTAQTLPDRTPLQVEMPVWTGRLIVVAIAAAVAAIAITSDVWADLAGFAIRDEESGHILFVPVVAAVLFWVRRNRVKDCRVSDCWMGTLIVGLGWACWSIGYRWNHYSLWYLGAILMPVGALMTFLGKDVVARFLPVAGVLIFLIPVLNGRRDIIAQPLETATAEITRFICDLMGMNIERHGNLLTVNGVQVAVAEACNGMRMIFTLLLMSYLYAFASPLGSIARAVILLLSPVTSVVCNVIRLVPTAWVFGHASLRTAERFHDWSGWAMILVGFFILTYLVKSLKAVAQPRAALQAEAG